MAVLKTVGNRVTGVLECFIENALMNCALDIQLDCLRLGRNAFALGIYAISFACVICSSVCF
jgi:hypothetical protein